MTTITREIAIGVPPEAAWEALRDFGALATLAPGFIAACTLDGDIRTVTFGSGTVLREQLVAVDDDARRLVWTIIDQPFAHHNGAARIVDAPDGTTIFEWTADLLPAALAIPTAAAMERGLAAIKAALESRIGTLDA